MLTTILSEFFVKVVASKRLIIEYLMIAIIIIISAASVWLWLQKNASDKRLLKTQVSLSAVQGRLTTVETINDSQEQHILQLKELRLRDAKAITGLLTDYKDLSTKDTTVRTRLNFLEKSNATVRDYLHQPIPADLMCLLQSTCSADQDSRKASAGKTTSGANSPVSTP